jgi:hypothetical protein
MLPPCSSTRLADDRQAEAEAAVGAGDRPIRPTEPIEHERHEGRIDAASGVADIHPHHVGLAPG